MKALTLTQPWATLVALRVKTMETRSWRTHYRGPPAIHAARGFPKEAVQLCFQRPFAQELARAGIANPADLPRGAVVAVAVLTGCGQVMLESFARKVAEPERSFGDFSKGRYVWHLANVRALPKPVEVPGALGLWGLPPDVAAAIRKELASCTSSK